LLPIAANIESEADIEYEAVTANYVLAQMEQANNGLNIVILDACRNTPFSRSFSRSLNNGLAIMDAPGGSMIAFATAPGHVALEGTGRNGIFTKHLLSALSSNPNRGITDVLIEVTNNVNQETNGKQVPWQHMSLTHQFCFAKCNSSVAALQQPRQEKMPLQEDFHTSIRSLVEGRPDDAFSASSSYNDEHCPANAKFGSTSTPSNWSAKTKDEHQWLGIDLGDTVEIHAIATKGRFKNYAQWVTSYQVSYSADNLTWEFYQENGRALIFKGNTDTDTEVRHELQKPILARFVKFHPMTWHEHITMRVEIYGVPSRKDDHNSIKPIVEGLPDDAFSASSSYNDDEHCPANAKFGSTSTPSNWSARTSNEKQWLSIDLGDAVEIHAIATKGRFKNHVQWVTSYQVSYSADNLTWNFYQENGRAFIFKGNTDIDTEVRHELQKPIGARFVKFHPITWHEHITMRVEMYGIQPFKVVK